MENNDSQYAKGGNVAKIEKKVAEVNALIEKGNQLGLEVVDSSTTWQTPMKYKPIKYSNGVLYIEYEQLDLYALSHKGVQKWDIKKDKVLKRHMEFHNPLNDIARMYRKAIRDSEKYFSDGGEVDKTKYLKGIKTLEKQIEEKEDELRKMSNPSVYKKDVLLKDIFVLERAKNLLEGKIDDKTYDFLVTEYPNNSAIIDDEPKQWDFEGTKERVIDFLYQRMQRGYSSYFSVTPIEGGWFFESHDLDALKAELESNEYDEDDENYYAQGGKTNKKTPLMEYQRPKNNSGYEDNEYNKPRGKTYYYVMDVDLDEDEDIFEKDSEWERYEFDNLKDAVRAWNDSELNEIEPITWTTYFDTDEAPFVYERGVVLSDAESVVTLWRRGRKVERDFYDNEYAKGGTIGHRTNGEINGTYLDSFSEIGQEKILTNIANHYGIYLHEANDEIRSDEAEMLYEYIADDDALKMRIYSDLKERYAKGGEVGQKDSFGYTEEDYNKPIGKTYYTLEDFIDDRNARLGIDGDGETKYFFFDDLEEAREQHRQSELREIVKIQYVIQFDTDKAPYAYESGYINWRGEKVPQIRKGKGVQQYDKWTDTYYAEGGEVDEREIRFQKENDLLQSVDKDYVIVMYNKKTKKNEILTSPDTFKTQRYRYTWLMNNGQLVGFEKIKIVQLQDLDFTYKYDGDLFAKGGEISDEEIMDKIQYFRNGIPPKGHKYALRHKGKVYSSNDLDEILKSVKNDLNNKKFAKGGKVAQKVFVAEEDGILGIFSGSDAYSIQISKGDTFVTYGDQDDSDWWYVKKVDKKPTTMSENNTFDYTKSKSRVKVNWDELLLTFPKGEKMFYAQMIESKAKASPKRRIKRKG